MKIFYKIVFSLFLVALLFTSGCVQDYQFSASSDTRIDRVTGIFIYNEGGKGKITIDAKTSGGDNCYGEALLNWNQRIHWGRQGTFDLLCGEDLKIIGTFELNSGNINQGLGLGEDQQGNQYDFVFGFKQNN